MAQAEPAVTTWKIIKGSVEDRRKGLVFKQMIIPSVPTYVTTFTYSNVACAKDGSRTHNLIHSATLHLTEYFFFDQLPPTVVFIEKPLSFTSGEALWNVNVTHGESHFDETKDRHSS